MGVGGARVNDNRAQVIPGLTLLLFSSLSLAIQVLELLKVSALLMATLVVMTGAPTSPLLIVLLLVLAAVVWTVTVSEMRISLLKLVMTGRRRCSR